MLRIRTASSILIGLGRVTSECGPIHQLGCGLNKVEVKTTLTNTLKPRPQWRLTDYSSRKWQQLSTILSPFSATIVAGNSDYSRRQRGRCFRRRKPQRRSRSPGMSTSDYKVPLLADELRLWSHHPSLRRLILGDSCCTDV